MEGIKIIRWAHYDEEGKKKIGGMFWTVDDGTLIKDSVYYKCPYCPKEHTEHDKIKLFDPNNGARWIPTAKPFQENVRSYHLPAMYAPIGTRKWWECVSRYLEGYDEVEQKKINDEKFQAFYNNILGEPYYSEERGVDIEDVLPHRKPYKRGTIPNDYAKLHSGSEILFLTCTVDIQGDYLAVMVFGWCKGQICYVIDYFNYFIPRNEKTKTDNIEASVWEKLRALIIEKTYEIDGKRFFINKTFIDASSGDSGGSGDAALEFLF